MNREKARALFPVPLRRDSDLFPRVITCVAVGMVVTVLVLYFLEAIGGH